MILVSEERIAQNNFALIAAQEMAHANQINVFVKTVMEDLTVAKKNAQIIATRTEFAKMERVIVKLVS